MTNRGLRIDIDLIMPSYDLRTVYVLLRRDFGTRGHFILVPLAHEASPVVQRPTYIFWRPPHAAPISVGGPLLTRLRAEPRNFQTKSIYIRKVHTHRVHYPPRTANVDGVLIPSHEFKLELPRSCELWL